MAHSSRAHYVLADNHINTISEYLNTDKNKKDYFCGLKQVYAYVYDQDVDNHQYQSFVLPNVTVKHINHIDINTVKDQNVCFFITKHGLPFDVLDSIKYASRLFLGKYPVWIQDASGVLTQNYKKQ